MRTIKHIRRILNAGSSSKQTTTSLILLATMKKMRLIVNSRLGKKRSLNYKL